MAAQCRHIWGDYLLHTWEGSCSIVYNCVSPCQCPWHLDPEDRALIHQLGKAELVRSGVNEIHRRFSLTLLQLNDRGSSFSPCLLSDEDFCEPVHRRNSAKFQ